MVRNKFTVTVGDLLKSVWLFNWLLRNWLFSMIIPSHIALKTGAMSERNAASRSSSSINLLHIQFGLWSYVGWMNVELGDTSSVWIKNNEILIEIVLEENGVGHVFDVVRSWTVCRMTSIVPALSCSFPRRTFSAELSPLVPNLPDPISSHLCHINEHDSYSSHLLLFNSEPCKAVRCFHKTSSKVPDIVWQRCLVWNMCQPFPATLLHMRNCWTL